MNGSKLLLTYNILAQSHETYLHFMMSEFMPSLPNLGLTNAGVWHTAYGEYPNRLLVFAAETKADMQKALASEQWEQLETKLKTYVTDYTRRVVPWNDRFEF